MECESCTGSVDMPGQGGGKEKEEVITLDPISECGEEVITLGPISECGVFIEGFFFSDKVAWKIYVNITRSYK